MKKRYLLLRLLAVESSVLPTASLSVARVLLELRDKTERSQRRERHGTWGDAARRGCTCFSDSLRLSAASLPPPAPLAATLFDSSLFDVCARGSASQQVGIWSH